MLSSLLPLVLVGSPGTHNWEEGANKYPVEATDKLKIDSDMKAVSRLGEVVVELFHVEIGTEAKPNQRDKNVLGAVAADISEKALKGRALSHGTA